jgi:membrane protein implicated in regulation of membrane protease activity
MEMIEMLSKLIAQAPKIIAEAARSALGIVALMVMTLSITAFLLFGNAADNIKLVIFLIIVFSFFVFLWAILRVTQAYDDKERNNNHLENNVNAQKVSDLHVDVNPEQKSSSTPCHNLPYRCERFWGRTDEINRALKGLDLRYPIVSIEGMGGVGKTTLAIEIAHRCITDCDRILKTPFTVIAWVSAKEKPEKKIWLEDVINTIAQLLKHDDFTYLTLDLKRAKITEELSQNRILIVIDNYESIEDRELDSWIQDIPEPSKVLITSRHGQMRTVWPIKLFNEKQVWLLNNLAYLSFAGMVFYVIMMQRSVVFRRKILWNQRLSNQKRKLKTHTNYY